MWAQVILAAIAAAPEIIRSVEGLIPGKGRSAEKLEAASAQLRVVEPEGVRETQALTDARRAKLSADVRYANALAAAMATHGPA